MRKIKHTRILKQVKDKQLSNYVSVSSYSACYPSSSMELPEAIPPNPLPAAGASEQEEVSLAELVPSPHPQLDGSSEAMPSQADSADE